jgi:hypothetical protein
LGQKKLHGFPFAMGHLCLDRGGVRILVFFLCGRTDKKTENEGQTGRKKAGIRKILLETPKICHFGCRKRGIGAER